MAFTTFVNGTVADATEANKLASYYDEVSDAGPYNNDATDWTTAFTISSIKSKSAASYLSGIYVTFDFGGTAGSNTRTAAIKIVGSTAGTWYLALPHTADNSSGVFETTRQSLASHSSPSYNSYAYYIPFPPGIITGDTTYDLTFEYYAPVGGVDAAVRNFTARLFSTDNLATELT